MKFFQGVTTSSKTKYYRKTSSLGAEETGSVAIGSDVPHESRPLILRHVSVEGDDDTTFNSRIKTNLQPHMPWHRWFILGVLLVSATCCYLWFFSYHPHQSRTGTARWGRNPAIIVPIEDAEEYLISIGDGKQIWFRTWGNPNGIPVLFVHGGPGQAVADYHDGNKRFFQADLMFVVEVDQRGTGLSQPSVRDDYRNMKLYEDISIDLIARDYEMVRDHLRIDHWVVWGGSYGSTIGLNYCMRYPDSCIALLLRGIYLDTKSELQEVYTQRAFEDDPRKSAVFDILYQLAADEAIQAGLPPLDPNDDRRLLELYEQMITRGDRQAIWAWHAFETNLMEDDPLERLDPNVIVESKFDEAQSVAFFETRLWLHGTFERPSRLLERVDRIANIPTWICQGSNDNVCPAQNAKRLVKALEDVDASSLTTYFVNANHEDTDPVMAACLQTIIAEFLRSIDVEVSLD